MNPTPEEIEDIRDRVGSCDPSDADITKVWKRKNGDLLQTILAILRRQVADMLEDPAQHALAGEISENWNANLTTKRRAIDEVLDEIDRAALAAGEGSDSTPSAVVTGHLTRADLPRSRRC